MDSVVAALADPGRRTLIEALADRDLSAGELAALLPIARPGVSRHLRVLREAGLVETRAVGQSRVYRLRAEALAPVNDWINDRRTTWEQRMHALATEVTRGSRERS